MPRLSVRKKKAAKALRIRMFVICHRPNEPSPPYDQGNGMSDADRAELLGLVRPFYAKKTADDFRPGDDVYLPLGKPMDAENRKTLIDGSVDIWLRPGRYADRLETNLFDGIGRTVSQYNQFGDSRESTRLRHLRIARRSRTSAPTSATCGKNDLVQIAESINALGATIGGRGTGTSGEVGTSGYPPNHTTMGNGGSVPLDNALTAKIIGSIRDAGPDSRCKPSKHNTYNKRLSMRDRIGQHG